MAVSTLIVVWMMNFQMDARTEKQLYGRTKFAQLGKLSGIVYEAIYEGYRKVARDNRTTHTVRSWKTFCDFC